MAVTNPGFEIVGGTETEPQASGVHIAMLTLALKALSQRALVAATDLFSLLTIGSCFWLWYLTPKPDVLQIVSLSLYGLLILSINWIVRGRK
jgi:hypothetical protein